MSMFSLIRSGVTDLGNTMSPRWMCQRSTTWAGVLPARSAIAPIAGSSRTLPRAERRPGLDRDLVLGAEAAHVVLGQVRVHLDLVDRRDDVALAVQPPQVVGLEVGDADGPGAPLAVELLQGLPGRDEVAVVPGRQRPVDEEQVEVVDAQRLQRLVKGLAGVVGLVGVVVQLAGDEDLAPVQAGLR